jgi:hypothetical protein
MNIIRIASDIKLVGNERLIDGAAVVWVGPFDKADIRFQRYTKDYARYSERPYKVGNRGFKTIEAAVRHINRSI